jgi:hypothetical protein
MIYLHSTDPRQRAIADAVGQAIRAEVRQARKARSRGKGRNASGMDVARDPKKAK